MAVNCWVAPEVMLAVGGETAIDATVGVAAVTVSDAIEVNPLAAALMVAVPAATPVASPPELTVATAVLDEVQVTPEVSAPLVPLLYVAVAVNCCDALVPMLAVAGETAIEVMVMAAAVTVTSVEPVTPLVEAVTAALPAAIPVTMPVSLTEATAGLEEAQFTEEERLAVDPSL